MCTWWAGTLPSLLVLSPFIGSTTALTIKGKLLPFAELICISNIKMFVIGWPSVRFPMPGWGHKVWSACEKLSWCSLLVAEGLTRGWRDCFAKSLKSLTSKHELCQGLSLSGGESSPSTHPCSRCWCVQSAGLPSGCAIEGLSLAAGQES